ncbi:MAG TPA: M67 family metallopeptidase [Gammaproteobacteria bacterium]|jgi:proteasome lid subunit RPN8/RPN11
MQARSEIKITRPLATHLLALAQQSPEREICGLVGAIGDRPSTVYPVKNVAASPEDAFEMDPQDQIHALKTMRTKHENLFAIYHSHPASPAEPSMRDLENIGYPDTYQLIISLNTKGVLEMRAFRLTAEGMREITLTV